MTAVLMKDYANHAATLKYRTCVKESKTENRIHFSLKIEKNSTNVLSRDYRKDL